jgi:hypothetical protein
MKSLLSVFWTMMLSVGIAAAQVPDAISYQGRLLDSNGTAVTGTVDVAVSLHNAQSGGMQVYHEVIGLVPVVDGIYSFYWGSAGTSVVTATEQMAVGDGSTTVYGHTTKNTPLVNPSVTIGDGAYSWNDVSGSSSPANFLGTVSDYDAGSVSAIYLSGAPDTSAVINVDYSYTDSGVSGSLGDSPEIWMELSLDGLVLAPRQRVVAVPYSHYAAHALTADALTPSTSTHSRTYLRFFNSQGNPGYVAKGLPWRENGSSHVQINAYTPIDLPDGALIETLNASFLDSNNNSSARVYAYLIRKDAEGNMVNLGGGGTTGAWNGGETNVTVAISEVVDYKRYNYYIEIFGQTYVLESWKPMHIERVSIDYSISD